MPHLLTRAESGTGHVLLRPVGSLSGDTSAGLCQAITTALLDSGRVVVDLTGLQIENPARAVVFQTALNKAGGWPHARLVLFDGPDPVVDLLHRLRLTRTVPHAHTLGEAIDLLSARPPLVRRAVTLEPRPEYVRLVRTLTDRAGAQWGLPESAIHTARLVVTELATNAIVHAQTRTRVLIELADGTQLRLIVTDHSPQLPRQLTPDLYDEHGRGLHLVAALADRCGVACHGRHKETWAVIDLGRSARSAPTSASGSPPEPGSNVGTGPSPSGTR